MTFKVQHTVRSLVEIQMPNWATSSPLGYLFVVTQVNDNGTLLVSRSSPQGQATVRAEDVEPAYQVVNGISYSSRTSAAVIEVLEAARKVG